MPKSSPKHNLAINLSGVTTYQSGVVQSAAFRKLNRFTASFLKPYDLTTMEWFLLGTVYDAGPEGISLTRLKDKLATTMPFITTSVKTLLSKGALVKSQHSGDARTKIVVISPSYRKICLEIEEYLRVKMRELFYDHITPQELRTYVNVLYKISGL